MARCPKITAADCIERPTEIDGDADIAGIGVYWGFLVSAILAMSTALVIFIFDWCTNGKHEPHRIRIWLETFMLSLSDTQFITGLALLVAALFKECTMSVYHFNIVNDLVMLSTVTHAFSLLVLPKFFREHKWMAFLRIALIIVIGALALRSALLAQAMAAGHDADVAYLAACYLNSDLREIRPASNTNKIGFGLVVSTVIVLLFSLANFSVRLRRFIDSKGLRGYVPRLFLQLVVPFGIFSFATWKLFQDRSGLKFKEGNTSLKDNSQEEWGFGQLLTVLLFGVVLLSALEAWPASTERVDDLRRRGIKPNAFLYDRTDQRRTQTTSKSFQLVALDQEQEED